MKLTFGSLTLPLLLLPIAASAQTLEVRYAEPASKIIDAAQSSNGAYEKLIYLCDRIGNRVSGSQNLTKAIEWAKAEMTRDGLVNVSSPLVKVPHWVRGEEGAAIIAPIERPLTMIGLGDSVGTGGRPLSGDVVIAHDFNELERMGKAAVQGKIVLFNEKWDGYGYSVQYRTRGPSIVAKMGAIAMLIRSVTGLTMQIPHTGTLEYAQGAPQIPAAAITPEDASLIERLITHGSPVKVRLMMNAQMLPDADSANVIGEIRGSEKPEEVVVMGGHIDSWDVGQGAQDDGSGIVTAMEAAALIHKLGLKPRRTIRVVLFTNEENGGAGGRAYREMIGNQIKNHVAAIEMDGGAEKISGYAMDKRILDKFVGVERLLAPIGADHFTPGGGGSDIGPIVRDGVPGLSPLTSGGHYFDWHHTKADTVDKIDPKELREHVAAMAVISYILADMPERP
ncbi:MAG TPA: M20/M25/M40 family metallo-hydrolase [Bryobacteraceae bacterium]|jgi:Zn-dependent M28 family amino/carboxypeptidase